MTQVYKLLGIDARTNTFYHPASQGKVERSHQVIANMLAKFVSSGQTDWDLYVPQCMMAMNTSVHSATGFSPYYLVHGRHPTLPPDALLLNDPPPDWQCFAPYVEELLRHTHQAFAEANERIGKTSAKNRDRLNARARLRQIGVGERVLLYTPKVAAGEKRKLAMYWRPGYTVVQKFGNVNYLIEETNTGNKQLVHVDRIKLQQSLDPTGAVAPPEPTESHDHTLAPDAPPHHCLTGQDWEWQWQPRPARRRRTGHGSTAIDRAPSPDHSDDSTGGPASSRSAPISDQEDPDSISLTSTDGLRLSSACSAGRSSVSDSEDDRATPPPQPPVADTPRRYPARDRRAPNRYTP